jgi:hypothetical protein
LMIIFLPIISVFLIIITQNNKIFVLAFVTASLSSSTVDNSSIYSNREVEMVENARTWWFLSGIHVFFFITSRMQKALRMRIGAKARRWTHWSTESTNGWNARANPPQSPSASYHNFPPYTTISISQLKSAHTDREGDCNFLDESKRGRR